MEESGSGLFSLEQLASALKHAREQRNLSLDEVSRHVGINRAYIEKIESGDFTFLPGVYVLAYIKEYAGLLDIGNEETFRQIRDLLIGRNVQTFAVPGASFPSEKPVVKLHTESWSSIKDFFISRKFFAVLTTIILFLALFAVLRVFRQVPSETPEGGLGGNALIGADTAAVAEKVFDTGFMPVFEPLADTLSSSDSVAAVSDTRRLTELVAAEVFRSGDTAKIVKQERPKKERLLEIRIIEDETWIKVIADDSARVYAGGQFKKGDVLRYAAEKSFWVNIGRPSYVELYLDGKKQPTSAQRTLVFP
ncbi:MAG: helix-turn-helix domain-containing protein [Chlorobium sp.]|uniref:helix-turn-helix domain-containing protein n=1 Tax=Chlorobium sp. TaxID=1095 RepID=UPI0025C2874B|nr:helix-turn-helix domain-containing protein [Chlorobium sp.]MCF8215452.1 helix-turn-helix domain-containing protein [Chlorobium sp.]MCF8270323.1 helix-turn-helix domain-containing protein [Chlorobium sp.]MCF8286659.1 helix-turn-helix domain-containing protein [Chlorobium sp.]MCF8290352.1 helix-turn-helix domain-containing protein [Chlorobium sp.]MCF8384235.1 helix-turn-helix domain-containing protein [Chlorobium sp.]